MSVNKSRARGVFENNDQVPWVCTVRSGRSSKPNNNNFRIALFSGVHKLIETENLKQNEAQTARAESTHVAEWYFQCAIVLSQIVGLCVLRCRVGMVGTNWLNLDIYRLSINLIMLSQDY